MDFQYRYKVMPVSIEKINMTYAFVELKSYGDLVITVSSIRLLAPSDASRCRLVIAPHLVDLAGVLAPPCATEVLPIVEPSVPALFDLKKRGLTAGIKSAFSLRRTLLNAAPGATLVLPRASFREQFIAGRRTWQHLPFAENVYMATEKFLQRNFSCMRSVGFDAPSPSDRIAICPYSRVAVKNLPDSLIKTLTETCARAGLKPEILLLEGERLDAQIAEASIRTIPRRFDALVGALSEYAGVISADSLSAHLAEYLNTPAFVATPVPNSYWLPLRAFQGQYWGVFGRTSELTRHLERFLRGIQNGINQPFSAKTLRTNS